MSIRLPSTICTSAGLPSAMSLGSERNGATGHRLARVSGVRETRHVHCEWDNVGLSSTVLRSVSEDIDEVINESVNPAPRLGHW